jgi:hypothetical protein
VVIDECSGTQWKHPRPPSSKAMQEELLPIRIKFLGPEGEKTLDVDATRGDTPPVLRGAISDQVEGLEGAIIRLIYRGRVLMNDSETIGDIVGANITLPVFHAVVRPPPSENTAAPAQNPSGQIQTGPRIQGTLNLGGGLNAVYGTLPNGANPFGDVMGEIMRQIGGPGMLLVGGSGGGPTQENVERKLQHIMAHLRNSDQLLDANRSIQIVNNRYELPESRENPREPSAVVVDSLRQSGTQLEQVARVLDTYADNLMVLAQRTHEFATRLRSDTSSTTPSTVPMNLSPLPFLERPSDALRQESLMWLQAHNNSLSAGRSLEQLAGHVASIDDENSNYSQDSGTAVTMEIATASFPVPMGLFNPTAAQPSRPRRRAPRRNNASTQSSEPSEPSNPEKKKRRRE